MSKEVSNLQILIDKQEKLPYIFSETVSSETVSLKTGDYTLKDFKDEIIIERKSLNDYVNTIINEKERFFRELDRARTCRFFAIIVEGSWPEIIEHKYGVENVTWQQVLGMTTHILLYYRYPIIFCTDRQHALIITEKLLRTYQEEREKIAERFSTEHVEKPTKKCKSSSTSKTRSSNNKNIF